ncbi:hypothetical protein L3Q82_021202, partial [Scortum barcoo]
MWKDSLRDLQDIRILRAYTPTSLSTAQKKELHFFSDASVKAIAAVGYLKVIDSNGECHISFVLGKAKLAPLSAHTIPRLELGAAVLAVEMVELVQRELDRGTFPCHNSLRPSIQAGISSLRAVLFMEVSRAGYRFLDRKRAAVTARDKTTGTIKPCTAEQLSKAETLIISCVQRETYREEFDCLAGGKTIPKGSPIRKLDPYMDEEGLLRIGGRLKHAALDVREQFPVVIPARSHIGKLLVRHYHEKVKHQGRVFTEGSIRTAGYWIIGAKRCINSILSKCVVCKKLCGRTAEQKMADLPPDRLSTEPPFTYVGLDVFGPWIVTTRRTRGGQVNSKRWAVLFTCMTTRAVHIELIESMETSSFINALRRFFALRGPVKQIRSDCMSGTNFTGACKELHMVLTDPKEPNVRRYLGEEGCTWIFNPPHSSHMGGVWERMIGVSRRILDSMLGETSQSRFTHEVLSTLMAEVTAIINARPLTPISSDPESPFLLTPASLLTQKVCTLPPPPGTFDSKDLHRRQWKQVQHLANTFWHRWRREYLPMLQSRSKWQDVRPNLKEGDLVLLKDNQVKRNELPLALVTKTFPDKDGKVSIVERRWCDSGPTHSELSTVSNMIKPKSSIERLSERGLDSVEESHGFRDAVEGQNTCSVIQ